MYLLIRATFFIPLPSFKRMGVNLCLVLLCDLALTAGVFHLTGSDLTKVESISFRFADDYWLAIALEMFSICVNPWYMTVPLYWFK